MLTELCWSQKHLAKVWKPNIGVLAVRLLCDPLFPTLLWLGLLDAGPVLGRAGRMGAPHLLEQDKEGFVFFHGGLTCRERRRHTV
jgi:hypothetical protein